MGTLVKKKKINKQKKPKTTTTPHTSSGLNVANRNHSCTEDRPNLQLMHLLETYINICACDGHIRSHSIIIINTCCSLGNIASQWQQQIVRCWQKQPETAAFVGFILIYFFCII